MFVVSAVEIRTWPHSRGRSRRALDAGCAAGLGFPVFCERLKEPNTSVSARMPQHMLLPPETAGRAASQQGGLAARPRAGQAAPGRPEEEHGGRGWGTSEGDEGGRAGAEGPVSQRAAAGKAFALQRHK